MTKNLNEALRRADRALLGAFLLTASFAAGIIAGNNAPSTEQVTARTKQVAHSATQLAHNTAQAVSGAAHFVQRTGFEAVSYIAMTPGPSVLRSVGMSNAPRMIGTASAAELEMVRILEDQRCLAEAMYYEARGEGRSGQEAIAEVVFHRMRTPGYPRSICGVVYQGANRAAGCQFSFACNGELLRPKTSAAWSQARILAAKIMAGVVQLEDITGDAISFHAADIQPDWADHLERTIQIGNHVFYRSLSRSKSS
jgi:hypothetical protein